MLGYTIAAEIGDITRFSTELFGCTGLCPSIEGALTQIAGSRSRRDSSPSTQASTLSVSQASASEAPWP
ncbi:hypothetical protein [Geodermatophilus sp. URMC 64]